MVIFADPAIFWVGFGCGLNIWICGALQYVNSFAHGGGGAYSSLVFCPLLKISLCNPYLNSFIADVPMKKENPNV